MACRSPPGCRYMSDIWIRVLVALAIVAIGLGATAVVRIRERRRAALAPLDLTGVSGRVLLFTDSACRRCDAARLALESAGVEFREIAYQHEPDLMRRVGVTGVPLIVGRRVDGAEVGRIAGKPGERAIKRLVHRLGNGDG